MNLILYPFMLLAACGFALSMAAHGMALAGAVIPGGKLVLALHIGIFVVLLPVVFLSRKTARNANGKDFWKIALAGCPVWMRRGFYVLFAYGIFNFILLIATTVGQPKHQTGDALPSVIRGFSGHWMVFYGAAFAVLYSRIHAPHLYRERKCPQGHVVTPIARFFAWRPVHPEGYHPHWRVDCFVRVHELSPEPKMLGKALAKGLLQEAICTEPLWVSWHRSEEIGGTNFGEVFDFD